MVVDPSALIAILEQESKADHFAHALAFSKFAQLSAASYLEAAIVMFHRRGIGGLQKLDDLIENFGIEIESFDEKQAQLAVRAYQQFGRGQHPAKLNLGDCFSYALAKSLDLPLLFKGNDFSKTDLQEFSSKDASQS